MYIDEYREYCLSLGADVEDYTDTTGYARDD